MVGVFHNVRLWAARKAVVEMEASVAMGFDPVRPPSVKIFVGILGSNPGKTLLADTHPQENLICLQNTFIHNGLRHLQRC